MSTVTEAGIKRSARRRRRSSADERRRSVLEAATAAFARGGLAGTSTEEIAALAGISQPYLFRLFGTKRDLFLATVERMHDRIEQTFRQAAEGYGGVEAKERMGQAYQVLLGERDLLLVQLHAYAAADDEVVRQTARQGWQRLWDLVEELTGLPEEDIRNFFATGMLLNVMAAMDAGAVDERWARLACGADAGGAGPSPIDTQGG